MEAVSDGCPTGILVDIDLQTKVSSNIAKENGKIQASIKNKKEKNIATDTKSSHTWSSNSLLDESPPRPSSILQMNVFFTPKSNWKTPSPKSMKIISREASRIVDHLYSSPINCSEVMIYDEVFPAVKSLDACLDEFQIKSRSLPTTDMTFAPEKIDQSNPDSLDLTKCTVSAVSCCTSKDVVSDEKLATTALQSDIKGEKEQNSISGKAIEIITLENVSNQKSCDESDVSENDMDKCVNKSVNSSLVISECVNVSSDKFLAPEHEVTIPNEIPRDTKGFKISLDAEKDKENILQSNGARGANYGLRFSKAKKTCSSIEYGSKETKAEKNQILRRESLVEKSSKKNTIAKYLSFEKKDKENRNLEHDFSKKPRPLQQKSNVSSQSHLYKKDPLWKTAPLFETPLVTPSISRIHSFHAGSSRNAIPTVERKFIPSTDSCSRVLKPKMSLNQVSNNGNGLSTPLQFGRKLASSLVTNPIRRKSLAFNSKHSLVASDIKVATQIGRCSIVKKPALTSSTLGLEKKLNMPSSHPKFKNDSLPRKLFP